MDRKLESNTYTNLVEFTDDAQRIFDNCRAYNDPGSNCESRNTFCPPPDERWLLVASGTFDTDCPAERHDQFFFSIAFDHPRPPPLTPLYFSFFPSVDVKNANKLELYLAEQVKLFDQ